MKIDPPVTFKPETAAEAWLGLLAARGIDYLFANGGTDFGPVVEAYAKGQKLGWRLPEVVIVPHENMGLAMAHGYAMVTGRPQAMMVHVGVGWMVYDMTEDALNLAFVGLVQFAPALAFALFTGRPLSARARRHPGREVAPVHVAAPRDARADVGAAHGPARGRGGGDRSFPQRLRA